MSDCAYCVANYLVNMIVLKKTLVSKAGSLMAAKRLKVDFLFRPKITASPQSWEQSDAKNCRHSPLKANVGAKSKVDVARKR